MKKAITLFVLLGSFLSFGQEKTIHEDAKELVKLTFDMTDKNQMKYMLSSNMEDDKREAFRKEIDVAMDLYITEASNFYIAKYTHEEIKEMLRFYETPVGKKIAKDSRKLLDGSFPKGKEWDMQIYSLKEKKKQ